MENVEPLKQKRLLTPTLTHHAAFGLLCLAGVLLFSGPLRELARFSWGSQTYSHILLIPLMSLGLMFMNRGAIFSHTGYAPALGLPIVLIGLMLYWVGRQNAVHLSANDALAAALFAAVIFWIGGFVTIYGTQAFRKASFPLLMLVFMIPFPDFLYEMIVSALQTGSTEAAYWLFSVTGTPVLRDGFVFSLPGLDIEVAKQCSGIRSGLSLFIVSLLEAHLFLKTFRNKVLIALSAIFIAMFKNGLRIVTISLLAMHVDRGFLSGDLHTRGGIPFFALAFVMLTLVLWGLRRSEGSGVRSEA